MKVLLFVSIFTFSFSTSFANTCVEAVQKKYKIKGPDAPYGSDSLFIQGNKDNEISILVHGYMATPFEVLPIGERLNQVLGSNVYMPLLRGFGSSAEEANKMTKEIWKEQIRDIVETLGKCYKKIHLGGMSLGGALTTNYVLNDYLPRAKALEFKLKSLTLFSPYFDISIAAGRLVIPYITNYANKVPLTTLATLTQSDDLDSLIKNNNFYNSEMPVKALPQLFALGEELQSKVTSKKATIPVQVFVSEYDETINSKLAASLPKMHFSDVEVFKLEKDLRVPHQITLPEVNPAFDTILMKNVLFINKNR